MAGVPITVAVKYKCRHCGQFFAEVQKSLYYDGDRLGTYGLEVVHLTSRHPRLLFAEHVCEPLDADKRVKGLGDLVAAWLLA